jgi:hypothetical protein
MLRAIPLGYCVQRAINADAHDNTWTRLYVDSLKWIHDMVIATWTKAAEGGTPVEVIEVMADYMDGRDAVDDESIALFQRARDALDLYRLATEDET